VAAGDFRAQNRDAALGARGAQGFLKAVQSKPIAIISVTLVNT
jgi:hypothetical protein